MSADTLRKGSSRASANVIRPAAVNEKTFMESVAGIINEVGLSTQPYSTSDEKDHVVLWTKLEICRNDDLKTIDAFGTNEISTTHHSSQPLLLTIGYQSGLNAWLISLNGDAQEIFSWRKPNVRFFKVLPSPENNEKDEYRSIRPIAVVCEGASFPSSPNQLNFMSIRTGKSIKNSNFVHPVCDVLANSIAVLVIFLDKILVLDPFKFETKVTIISSGAFQPGVNSVAMGSTWLAYCDQKLVPVYQSAGGAASAGTSSYAATMLHAAKSFTKGLKGFSETVASSITGHRVASSTDIPQSSSEPGIVTIININELKSGEFSLTAGNFANASPESTVIAHFIAHANNPVLAMNFDSSGVLLVTADKEGHDFHVFRIHPHPLGSAMGAVHHLYVLHRGDTAAKVQNISFASDSRWVAISTLRGTTHIFPITPYGGQITVRTHGSHRVVNRLSRFHRTAGLDETPTSGRNSPVLNFNSNHVAIGKQSFDLVQYGSPYPNARLQPFPQPIIVSPLAQLRQNYIVSSSPKNSPPISKSKSIVGQEDSSHVVCAFEASRGWLSCSMSSVSSCEKRKKSPVDALFVMTSHGSLIEYSLEPKCHSGIVKEKVCDDTPIELSVHARAQWKFSKPSFSKELQPPLDPNSQILHLSTGSNIGPVLDDSHSSSGDKKVLSELEESSDERWLSQVEITTHCGPHRRLWMGPQFSFKIFNPSLNPSGSKAGLMDVETVEVSVTNRPAKSNPVNMPVSSSLLPVVLEGSSGSSLEQSPRLLEPYSDLEAPSGTSDSQIKENLADAMLENCQISSRITGGCQSLGSCDDLSCSSFDSTSQNSVDAPIAPTFCIEANTPFPD